MKRMGHRGAESRGCPLSGLRVRDAEGMAVEARGSDCSADRRRKITNAKCNGGSREDPPWPSGAHFVSRKSFLQLPPPPYSFLRPPLF